MSARRCFDCGNYWPDQTHYATCPVCETPTKLHAESPSLSIDGAKREVKRLKFENFYAKWEATHTRPNREERAFIRDLDKKVERIRAFQRTLQEIRHLPTQQF